MSWVCPDASVLVRLLTGGSRSPAALEWTEWIREGRTIAAPSLLPYEVTNALWRYAKAGLLTRAVVDEALDRFLELGIALHAEPDLHRQALDLADRFAMPAACDAHYLALAQSLAAELWTADERLVAGVGQELPWVRQLPNP